MQREPDDDNEFSGLVTYLAHTCATAMCVDRSSGGSRYWEIRRDVALALHKHEPRITPPDEKE